MIKKGSVLKTLLISILIIFSFISTIFIYSSSFTISIYRDSIMETNVDFLVYLMFIILILSLLVLIVLGIVAFIIFMLGKFVVKDESRKLVLKKYLFIFLLFLFIITIGYVFRESIKDPTMKFMVKQLIFYILGFSVLIIFSNINYKIYQKHRWVLFVMGIIMLILVLFIGIKVKGATRWIAIGGITIQPAEFAKLLFVIYFSGQLTRYHEKNKSDAAIFFPGLIVSLIYVLLIVLERDLSSSIHLFVVAMFMIFISNVKKSYSFTMLGIVTLFGILVIKSSSNRSMRVEQFLKGLKENGIGGGYQATQSVIGIGNGGLFGLGFGNGIQKYFFLPERHTDFIFSIIAEEVGFLGVTFIIALYILITFIGFKIIKNCEDEFGKYIAFGIISLVMVQTMINLFVVTGLVPTTGVTLPFISYGGSSLLTLMIAFGVLINIIKEGGKE